MNLSKPSVYKFLELDVATNNLCIRQRHVKSKGANKTGVPFKKKGGGF